MTKTRNLSFRRGAKLPLFFLYIAAMKKLLIILIVVSFSSCSEDDSPEFKIQDQFFVSRFEKFSEIGQNLGVTVPRNNLILRYVDDPDLNVNNSKSYTKDGQLYIDVDRKFNEALRYENENEVFLFQQFANALINTPYRDCGMMKKVNTYADLVGITSLDYDDYANLFDPQSPCME